MIRAPFATMWIAFAVLFAACSESARITDAPTAPEFRASASNGTRQGGEIASQARIKRYRVRVDRGKKTVELESVTQSAGSCSPTQLTCDDGSTACRPLDPQCGPWYGTLDISGEDSIYINQGASGYDQYVDEYGPYFCPMYVDDPHFEWRGHHFKINGRVTKITDLPMTSGIPKARYSLPPGPWISDDGQARIWSGTIDGTCFVREHHVLGFRITEGYIGWYKFNGDGDDSSSTGSGGGTWVSYGGAGGGEYIDSEAAQVVQTYLEDGTCTDGWVIIVDGERVC
jgi:hypothetical protein